MQRSETSPAERAELVVCFDGWRRRVPLEAQALVLGRAPECDIQLADGRLSRRHCRIWPAEDGTWMAEDLGSQAGTSLAGVPLTSPAPLRPGDRLLAGPLETYIELVPADAAVLSGDTGRDARNVGALLRTVDDLHRTRDLDTLLRTIVDRTITLAGAERGALLLAGASRALEVVVARDGAGRDLPLDQTLTRSLPARALGSGRAVLLTDAEAPGQREDLSESVFHGGLRSVLCVPLPGDGRPMGVLYVDGRRPAGSFGPAELGVFEALAAHGALAIERERLREEQARGERESRGRLEAENATLRAQLGTEGPLGESAPMRKALEMIRRLAPSDATVCLSGETGTGKEVLARHLHRLSPRSGGPFVVVDCGAIPEGLIESELFGHEKGSFTGAAAAREGRFRAAEGGTVFLDEVAELPLGLQTRLLRVLQEHSVQPVGASTSVPVDARVVCATHRDLPARVAGGQFRQDLYYRIAVLNVTIPPLRERGEDVPLLARHFLTRFAAAYAPGVTGFTREAMAALCAHDWPGNVRELEQRIQRSVLMANPPYVTRRDLDLGETDAEDRPEPAEAVEASGALAPLQEARAEATESFERAYVQEALRRTGGNVLRAASLAGVSKQLFRRLMQRHGIERGSFL